MDTPTYIKGLLKPNGKRPAGRKVWSIDLETVWLPFFTATNTMGESAIPHEALGAPLRLAYNLDGTVKFGKTGRPVIKVAKEMADSVKLARENFAAQLVAYANGVALENPEGYKAEVQANAEAGKPILAKDREALDNALATAMEQAIAEAEKAKAEAPKPKPKRKAKAKAEAQAEPPEAPTPEPTPELVTA
jgi:hypothetical protein